MQETSLSETNSKSQERDSPAKALGAEPNRLHSLDGLRGIAALLVLLHHAYIHVWNIFAGEHPDGLFDSLTGWMIYGHFAVSVFIVLSGFSLMLPVVRKGEAKEFDAALFYRKRARRILPPYYFTLLFSVVIGVLAPKINAGVSFPGVLAHIFLIHNLFPRYIASVNGPLWSIAVECQIYLFFPLLVWLWRKFGGLWVALLALPLSVFLSRAVHATSLGGLTPHYIALFVLGMLGCSISFSTQSLWVRLRERVPWRTTCFVLGLMIFGWCYWLGWRRALDDFQTLSDFAVGIWTMSILVVSATFPKSGVARVLSWKPISKLGEFAYSLYLVHLPLLSLSWRYLVQPLNLLPIGSFCLILVACVVIVGIARGFYVVFELPFISKRQSPV